VSDPRVFFAAERTLLAWVRSGLTVMALGFVVARFGLFLTLMSGPSVPPDAVHRTHWPSTVLGIALLILGATVIACAAHNHRRYIHTLPLEDVPHLAVPWLSSFLSIAVALVGLLLAGYLAIS
jgi:putative membrane protein